MASARARMISCTRSMLARFRPPYRRASCSASASIQNARRSTPSTMSGGHGLGFDDVPRACRARQDRCDVLPDREVVAGKVGAGERRHDDPHVEIETLVARLAVEALHDRQLRRLGRRVRRGGVRGPVDARARRRREDRRSPALRHHARHEGAQAVQQAEHVGVDGRAPHVEVRVEEPIGTRCSGVEERHVDPTEAVERGRRRGATRRSELAMSVGTPTTVVPPALSSSTARWSRSARRDREHQLHPAVGEHGRGRPADPRRATGDHRDLPLEAHDQAVGWSTLTEVRFSAVQSNVPGFFGNTRTHFSFLICITR